MVNNDVIPRKHFFCVVAEAWIFNNIAAIGVSDVLFKACSRDLILKTADVFRLKPCVEAKTGQEFHQESCSGSASASDDHMMPRVEVLHEDGPLLLQKHCTLGARCTSGQLAAENKEGEKKEAGLGQENQPPWALLIGM